VKINSRRDFHITELRHFCDAGNPSCPWETRRASGSIPGAGLGRSVVLRVEHRQIAAYGTVRTYAKRLGCEDHARQLDQLLQEEGETDKKLISLAESYIKFAR
jgi:hypothetical protein